MAKIINEKPPKSKEEILLEVWKKHFGTNFRIPALKKTAILEAMNEYAGQTEDLVGELFSKPLEELRPLQKLWQKENKKQHTTPDMTVFCRWIREKIIKKATKKPLAYGRAITLAELKQHYKYGRIPVAEFIDLLKLWHKQNQDNSQ